MLKIDKKNHRERNEQDRFDEQTRNGGGAGLFSKQSVKSEGDAKQNGDPRKTAVTESEIQHSERGEHDRRELQPGETFPEKKCAEENVH